MRLAFGILLFVIVYGPIAYMTYDELKRRQPRVRSRRALSQRQPGGGQPQAASQYQA